MTYRPYYLVVGSCLFVANAVVGMLWEHFRPSAAAIYSITLSSIAIVGMLIFILTQKRRLSPKEET